MNCYTFFKFANSCILHALLGIILGISIEKIFTTIKKNYIDNTLLIISMQIITIILILYLIQCYISYSFSNEWQEITPGIFFVAFLFNLQPTLYINIYDLLK